MRLLQFCVSDSELKDKLSSFPQSFIFRGFKKNQTNKSGWHHKGREMRVRHSKSIRTHSEGWKIGKLGGNLGLLDSNTTGPHTKPVNLWMICLLNYSCVYEQKKVLFCVVFYSALRAYIMQKPTLFNQFIVSSSQKTTPK